MFASLKKMRTTAITPHSGTSNPKRNPSTDER